MISLLFLEKQIVNMLAVIYVPEKDEAKTADA